MSNTKNIVPQLKDVAREANVSLATASIILRNGNGRFHEDTKRRVFEVARELGWNQNLLVQSIQTGKSKTIGVLVPPFDSYWVDVLSGIHQRLTESDYMPITLWAGDTRRFADESQGLEHIKRLIGHRVEGLIVWPDFAETYRSTLLELEETNNLPIVVIDHCLEGSNADSVQTDEEQGSKLVADHLLSLGHKNIACFSEFQKTARSWQLMRTKYFEFSLFKSNMDIKFKLWQLNDDNDNGTEVAREMLSGPDRPTAVFAETDHLAIDVYNAAKQLGIDIPGQLSVVGFSGLDFTSKMQPPLTTVMQQGCQVGKHASKMLVERIEGKEVGSAHTVKVGSELIVRNSTSVVRV